jgi:hypothetical protein
MLVPLTLPALIPAGVPALAILAGILILALAIWSLLHIADANS